jgi:hypothetical protein
MAGLPGFTLASVHPSIHPPFFTSFFLVMQPIGGGNPQIWLVPNTPLP